MTRRSDELLGFPLGRQFVLLPPRPMRATLGGLALYDAASPRQWLALRAGRGLIRGGLSGLLRLPRSPPLRAPVWWEAWVRDIAEPVLGPVSCTALRVVEDPATPPHRVSALLFDAGGRPLAFAKLLRRDGDRSASASVLRVIGALDSEGPESFCVPRLIAAGIHDRCDYLIQEALPERGHRRAPYDPRRLHAIVDEIQRRLEPVLERPSDVPDHHVPAHGSLTPLNLRITADRHIWLVDWDHAGWGPRLSDELRYWTADLARRPGSMRLKARRIAALLRERGDGSQIADALAWRRSTRPVERLPREQTLRDAVEHLLSRPGRVR